MENTVTNVFATLVAYMEPASNHGSATVKRAGVVSSATKVNLVEKCFQHCIYPSVT